MFMWSSGPLFEFIIGKSSRLVIAAERKHRVHVASCDLLVMERARDQQTVKLIELLGHETFKDAQASSQKPKLTPAPLPE